MSRPEAMHKAAVGMKALTLALVLVASFASAQTYLPLPISNPGSYDYAASVVRDDESGVLLSYSCSQDPIERLGDAIMVSKSLDNGQTWSTPTVAVRPGLTGESDDQDVCDPSVTQDPGGEWGRAGWRYVMYYNGVRRNPDGSRSLINRVHVALSMDGATWIKFHGNPIFSCGDVGIYGCGQFSVVQLYGGFWITFVADVPGKVGLFRMRSWDGFHFFDEQPWDVVCAGCTAAPDLLYDGATGEWLAVVTVNQREHLYRMPWWGGPSQLIGRLEHVSTWGSGFIRSNHGHRPPGPVRSTFGTPGFWDIAYDFNLQELRGVQW